MQHSVKILEVGAIVVGLSFGITIASATAVVLHERGRIDALEKDAEEQRIKTAGKLDLRDFQGWVRELRADPKSIPEAPR